jgi:Heavy-metal resistance
MRGPGMARPAFGRAGMLNNPAIRQRLGITAQQTTKIRQQNSDFLKSEIRNRADLQVKRIELNELLGAENPDRAAINAKLQEVSTVQMALDKAAIDNRLALRDHPHAGPTPATPATEDEWIPAGWRPPRRAGLVLNEECSLQDSGVSRRPTSRGKELEINRILVASARPDYRYRTASV